MYDCALQYNSSQGYFTEISRGAKEQKNTSLLQEYESL